MSGAMRAPRQDANKNYLPPMPPAVARAARESERLAERVAKGEAVPGQAPDGRDIPTMDMGQWRPPTNVTPPDEGTPPVEEPSSAAAPPPTPPAPPTPPTEDWEQKYRSLQGRFDSQVPALAERARTAESRVQFLEARCVDLQAQINALKTTPPTPGAAASEEDVKTWGQDFIEATRRQARAEVQGEIDALKTQIAEIGNRTQQSQAMSVKERTNLAIDRIMGDVNWQAINLDPKFIEWLQAVDNFSGEKRHNLLSKAYARGDAVTSANFFKAYLAEHTAPTPQPAQPPHTPEGAGRVSLEALAAPGSGGGAPPSGGGDGAEVDEGWVTQKEIAQHYQRVTQGYYRNNPRLQEQVGARIGRAVEQGRVR